jgi:hypothetical protein
MKNKMIKLGFVITFILGIVMIVNAQDVKTSNDNITTTQESTLKSLIKKDDIVQWLKKKITPSTPFRNKFITDILQNALFDEMYAQRKGTNIDSRLLIIPLKQSYISQHIDKNKTMPFQNLIVDIDKNDKIFTINLSLIYPLDTKIKKLPKNNYNNFYDQYNAIDGTYTIISIISGDNKIGEIDIEHNERTQARQWMRKKVEGNKYDWSLETTYIIKDKNGGDMKLKTTTQQLGISNKMNPPMFKGDLITKENL